MIQVLQGGAGNVGRMRIAQNGDPVAARHQGQAQPLFDTGKMAVMLTKQRRQQPGIIKIYYQGRLATIRCHAQIICSMLRAASKGANFPVPWETL